MGYHVGGLINHFVSVRRNDFFEMALHHIVALYLFGGCYMFNLWEGGSVIAFLHDIADITGNLTKTLTNTNYDTATAVVFVTTMIVWFYTRCFLLATYIYSIWTMEMNFDSGIVQPFFCYLTWSCFSTSLLLFSRQLLHFMKIRNSVSITKY